MNDTLDDYDFTPSANSSLASLFDISSENSDNASLIYTAPKQPKTGAKDIQSDTAKTEMKTDSTVICAKVVQVWKLIETKYSIIGKFGFAIIGSSNQSSYEVILYKDKRNVIMRAKISPNFEISQRKDNFISFFDCSKDNWLLKFNNFEDKDSVLDIIQKYGGRVKKLEEKTNNSTNETRSIENENTSETKAKNDILSRIAKMGQSILPNTNVELEEETVDSGNTNVGSGSTNVDSGNTNVSLHSESSQISQPISTMSRTNIIQPPRQIPSIPPTFVMSHQMPYDPLNLFLTENRCHNSEIKINLSQISEQLNNIMKMVDTGKSCNEPSNDVLKSKIKVLELRNENLLKELTTLQQENMKMKLQVDQQNDMLKEQEQNRSKLEFDKEEEIKRIQEIDSYKNNITKLSETVETQKNEIEQLRHDLENHDDSELKMEIFELKNTLSEVQLKLKESEEHKNEDVAMDFLQQDMNEKNTIFTALLKEEMNRMYGNIVSNFNEQSYIPEVSSIIAQNIKSTTLRIIQKFQQIYGIHNDPS